MPDERVFWVSWGGEGRVGGSGWCVWGMEVYREGRWATPARPWKTLSTHYTHTKSSSLQEFFSHPQSCKTILSQDPKKDNAFIQRKLKGQSVCEIFKTKPHNLKWLDLAISLLYHMYTDILHRLQIFRAHSLYKVLPSIKQKETNINLMYSYVRDTCFVRCCCFFIFICAFVWFKGLHSLYLHTEINIYF